MKINRNESLKMIYAKELNELKNILSNAKKIATHLGIITIIASILMAGCETTIIDRPTTTSENRTTMEQPYETTYSTKVNRVVKVKRGQTLSEIAEEYNTTVTEIKKINNIENINLIREGQELNVIQNIKVKEIFVGANDTLSSIANQNNTTVEELILLNKIKNPDVINVGQKLKVPYVESKKLDLNEWDKKIKEKGYVQGIDVSQVGQGEMDLQAVLNQNKMIDFVIVRSNYFWARKTKDETFDKFSKIAYDNGCAVGVYFWPTLKDKASTKAEIDIVLKNIKDNESKGIYYTMPIFIDIENELSGGGDLKDRIKAKDKDTLDSLEFAIEYIREQGYEVMLYSNASCVKECGLNSFADLYNVKMWIAGGRFYNDSINIYSNPLTYTTDIGIKGNVGRQYCDHGGLTGYSGNVDLNVWYENTPKKIIESGLNNTDEMPRSQVR